jgi:hypothetical protein
MPASGRYVRHLVLASGESATADRMERSFLSWGFRVKRTPGYIEAVIAIQTSIPDLVVLVGNDGSSQCSEGSRFMRDISRVPVLAVCQEKGAPHIAEAITNWRR